MRSDDDNGNCEVEIAETRIALVLDQLLNATPGPPS
ncbi:hypothetical protein BJY21_003409 [Kineosphaera limosa]|nr:hypothetical protein [Kineosphaera limosa]